MGVTMQEPIRQLLENIIKWTMSSCCCARADAANTIIVQDASRLGFKFAPPGST